MSKRVLLVEDELGLRTTLGDRLRREGYHVETAAEGATGFARASKEPFDLIVLELVEGLEDMTEIRGLDPQPVVLDRHLNLRPGGLG